LVGAGRFLFDVGELFQLLIKFVVSEVEVLFELGEHLIVLNLPLLR